MARSTLFRRLRRILRRAHASNLETQSGSSGPSRRDVLVGALGAAALIPLAGATSSCGGDDGGGKDAPTSSARVAIIGGGVAGTSAAYFLAEAGVKADVYEASMRIGGRMFTQRTGFASGQICELGGELVDTDHIVIPFFCDKFGFTLDDLPAATPGLEQDSFYIDGAFVSESALVAAFAPLAAKMDMAVMAGDADDAEFDRIDNLSIPEWLTTDGGLTTNSLMFKLLTVSYLEEFGLEVDQQSAWNLLTLIDYATPDPFHVFGDSDERFHVHQGNDSIPTALAATVTDQIHLDHALTKVVKTDAGFTLTFSTSGGDVTADVDHVIYALPFTKLREVDLGAAGLSTGKRDIIDHLGYGTNAKLMMQFHDRHWETHGSAGGAITNIGNNALQTTWATSRGQSGPEGLLTNFVGGQRGIDIGTGTPESQAQVALNHIDTLWPGTKAQYIANSAVRQHWPTYPYTKASYASYLKGQWAFFGNEGKREGNQHFCGEHCSEDFQGYMEGGAETGTMVAAEVLDDLGIAQPADLASLVAMLTAEESPRASYHAGFGKKITPAQRRRRRATRRRHF